MRRGGLAFTLLIVAGIAAWSASARAQLPAPVPQAAPAPAATADATQEVGSVATLQGSASVRRAAAVTPLKISDPIYKGDVLQTSADGTLGITFEDETTFTLKPDSRITVDDYLYQSGGTGNAAVFDVLRGTVAFVAAQVAKTGQMKIDTPTSTLGIRGTTGLIEVPQGAAGAGSAAGEVSIKLYADADGRVGRIEVFGRDGSQLGILSRGATGFAIRPGAPGAPRRFSAVALQISPQEAERDRSFVRQAFTARLVGRQINIQRRNLRQQQQRNQQRPGQGRPRERRPGQPGQRGGFQQRPGQFGPPGNRQFQRPGAAPGQRRPSRRGNGR